MAKRYVIVAVAVLLVLIGAVAFSARALQDRAARKRIEIGLTAVKPGMSKGDVERLLGQPTFNDQPATDTFAPADVTCREKGVAAYVYQAEREQTLVVVFNGQQRVECVEKMMAFRIIRR